MTSLPALRSLLCGSRPPGTGVFSPTCSDGSRPTALSVVFSRSRRSGRDSTRRFGCLVPGNLPGWNVHASAHPRMSPPAFPSRFCCCRRVSVLQARLVAPGAPGFQRCASVPSACALQAVVLSLAGLGTLAEAVLTPEQRQTLSLRWLPCTLSVATRPRCHAFRSSLLLCL